MTWRWQGDFLNAKTTLMKLPSLEKPACQARSAFNWKMTSITEPVVDSIGQSCSLHLLRNARLAILSKRGSLAEEQCLGPASCSYLDDGRFLRWKSAEPQRSLAMPR